MTAGSLLIADARAARHAAEINAREHSRLLQCLVLEQALNQPVF